MSGYESVCGEYSQLFSNRSIRDQVSEVRIFQPRYFENPAARFAVRLAKATTTIHVREDSGPPGHSLLPLMALDLQP
jgi:hypothetical protein